MKDFDAQPANEAERLLVASVADGTGANFSTQPSDPPAVLRASLLRHLLLGLTTTDRTESFWPFRSVTIRVHGARIEGSLDLSDCLGDGGHMLPSLVLENCDIPETINLSYAQLTRFSINNTCFTHVLAQGLRLSGPLE